jgi:hypothetical protein
MHTFIGFSQPLRHGRVFQRSSYVATDIQRMTPDHFPSQPATQPLLTEMSNTHARIHTLSSRQNLRTQGRSTQNRNVIIDSPYLSRPCYRQLIGIVLEASLHLPKTLSFESNEKTVRYSRRKGTKLHSVLDTE